MDIEKLLVLRETRFDPYSVLSLPRDAGDEEILLAYENLRRRAKTEALPAATLDNAYFCLKDGRSRTAWKLLAPAPLESIDEIKSLLRPKPKYLGPGIWLRSIRGLVEEKEHKLRGNDRGGTRE